MLNLSIFYFFKFIIFQKYVEKLQMVYINNLFISYENILFYFK